MTTFCPNLPGYIPTQNLEKTDWKRISTFKMEKNKDELNHSKINYPLPRQEKVDTFSPLRSQNSKTLLASQIAIKPIFTGEFTESFRPIYAKLDKQVLRFTGYFKENVVESATESLRVRKLDIYYYLIDDSISMYEPKQANSGMPQGIFLKRQKVFKSEKNGDFIRIEDLQIGKEVDIFGRKITICDCDMYTREFYEGIQNPQPPSINIPLDNFEAKSANKTVTQKDNEITAYLEKVLGGGRAASEKQFLQNDKKVLRFYAESGQKFTIHYFLADNTVEILEALAPNNGRDSIPQFLKRQKIFKGFVLGQPGHSSDQGFITPTDIKFGENLIVYGKKFLIKGCDAFTQSYYKVNFGVDFPCEIKEKIEPNKMENKPTRNLAKTWQGITPAYNGYGSEEDSLSNVFHLSPKAPKKNYSQFMENNYDLKFSAKMMSTLPEDYQRSFVITYFLQDDTIAIHEIPLRNSGFPTGKFLERGKYRKANGKYFSPFDFKVGKPVTITGRSFYLNDCTEVTKKWFVQHTI